MALFDPFPWRIVSFTRCEALDPNSKNLQPKISQLKNSQLSSKSTLRQTSSDIWSLSSQQSSQKLTKPLAERPSMGRRIQSALSNLPLALCAHSNPANVAQHSPLQLDTNPLRTDHLHNLTNPLCALDSRMIYISDYKCFFCPFYLYFVFLDLECIFAF